MDGMMMKKMKGRREKRNREREREIERDVVVKENRMMKEEERRR